jgi:hypothetical protein
MKKSGFFLFGKTREMLISSGLSKRAEPLHGFMVSLLLAGVFK